MHKFFLAVLFSIALSGSMAQGTSRAAEIRSLLELTGSGQLGVQMVQRMLVNFKQTFPEVPATFWDQLSHEFNADSIVNMIIPIYEKYYTAEEIKQLNAFYQTALGKKMIATTPLVMQESMEVGAAWGKEAGERVYNRLLKNGYLKQD